MLINVVDSDPDLIQMHDPDRSPNQDLVWVQQKIARNKLKN
jgi:hypothetical protein